MWEHMQGCVEARSWHCLEWLFSELRTGFWLVQLAGSPQGSCASASQALGFRQLQALLSDWCWASKLCSSCLCGKCITHCATSPPRMHLFRAFLSIHDILYRYADVCAAFSYITMLLTRLVQCHVKSILLCQRTRLWVYHSLILFKKK